MVIAYSVLQFTIKKKLLFNYKKCRIKLFLVFLKTKSFENLFLQIFLPF
jgi:hypothetical protein